MSTRKQLIEAKLKLYQEYLALPDDQVGEDDILLMKALMTDRDVQEILES